MFWLPFTAVSNRLHRPYSRYASHCLKNLYYINFWAQWESWFCHGYTLWCYVMSETYKQNLVPKGMKVINSIQVRTEICIKARIPVGSDTQHRTLQQPNPDVTYFLGTSTVTRNFKSLQLSCIRKAPSLYLGKRSDFLAQGQYVSSV
jgi:hypothetical protein